MLLWWCWGANSYGQLGLGHASEQEAEPRPLSPPAHRVKVVGGGGHTLALDGGGNLFVCGWNRFGQLGLVDPADSCESVTLFTRVRGVSDATDIAGGWDFSLVLLKNGTVLAAGSNRYGQLGKP